MDQVFKAHLRWDLPAGAPGLQCDMGMIHKKKKDYRCLLQRMGQHTCKSWILRWLYYCILSPLSALKPLSAGPWPTPETSSNGNRSAVTSPQPELLFYSDSFRSRVPVQKTILWSQDSLFLDATHTHVGSRDLGWWNTCFVPHHLQPCVSKPGRTATPQSYLRQSRFQKSSWGRYGLWAFDWNWKKSRRKTLTKTRHSVEYNST